MDTVCENVQRPLCDVGAQILWEEPPRAVSIDCYNTHTPTHARTHACTTLQYSESDNVLHTSADVLLVREEPIFLVSPRKDHRRSLKMNR